MVKRILEQVEVKVEELQACTDEPTRYRIANDLSELLYTVADVNPYSVLGQRLYSELHIADLDGAFVPALLSIVEIVREWGPTL